MSFVGLYKKGVTTLNGENTKLKENFTGFFEFNAQNFQEKNSELEILNHFFYNENDAIPQYPLLKKKKIQH